MNYLQFDFDVDSQEQTDQLIALLAAQGFEGFEEEGEQLYAFVSEKGFDENAFAEVMNIFSTISYTKTVVENINWNKRWEEGFTPVIIDDFVAVRASFHAPTENVAHEVIITPKMSFGTGHHATTYLMIKQMRLLDFKEKSVLDFGTGTGVLAILAQKMGAEKILAIDYDDWSIANARENIFQNSCDNIRMLQADQVPVKEKFNIVLANITLNVIKLNLYLISEACYPDAVILFSGFLKDDEMAFIALLETVNFKYLSTVQQGDWIAVMAKKELNSQ